jgi:microsomal dipeptidase-like Zn-dependent dipeptidase
MSYRGRVLGVVSAVLLAGVVSVPVPVAVAEPDVTALDGACVALRAPSGKYVVRNALGGYQSTGAGPTQPFRLQRTGTASYLLFGTGEDFLGAGLGALGVLSARAAGPSTDWRLTAGPGDAVTITSVSADRQLAVDPLLATLALRANGTPFTPVPASGCAAVPEADLNIEGTPFTGTTPEGEVRGIVDLHNHLTAFEFIGGEIHCGQPWSRYGITDALVDCPDHEPNGLGAWWENLAGGGYPTFTHDTRGWPTFRDWPKHNSWTHEASYYRWLERAWRGGLRIYTNLFVNNAALCEIYPLKRNPCEDMASIRLQAQRIHELQDFIDTQWGGPGRGWFRIVHDPAQARAVIEQGKLAVVLGVEVSQPFGCGIRDGQPLCDRADIDAGLDELYDLGVRRMFVCHKFDNALCGVRFDGGTAGFVVNAANFYSTGRFWEARRCTGPASDNTIAVESDVLAGPLQALLPQGVTLPVYPSAPHCNVHGLTDLGRYAMEGMMARGMMIDVDHMSVKAMDEALDLLEANNYPGVVSSHSWLDPSFYPRILSLGGMAGPYGHGTARFAEEWRTIRAAADPRYPFGTGAGFDTGGFGHQPPPRADAAAHPLEYPFQTFDGASTVDHQHTGDRVYDLNVDGMAHYGLLPDWLADLRLVAGADGDAITEDMARGAETYLRTWERVTP